MSSYYSTCEKHNISYQDFCSRCEREKEQRSKALKELTQLSEEMGLYHETKDKMFYDAQNDRWLPMPNDLTKTERLQKYAKEANDIFGPQRTDTSVQLQILEVLTDIVKKNPELRVGQIIANAIKDAGLNNIVLYSVLDENMLEYLKRFRDGQ